MIWKRPLGEGYTSPAVENRRLYTAYGKPREEVVIAAETETGKTLWERSNPMTFKSDAPEMGNGPYSTPLVVGDRLFTTGVAGRLQCLEKKTGKALWVQELWASHHGSRLMYGYASQPDCLSRPGHRAGRWTGQGADGVQTGRRHSVAWSKNDFGNVYSSPILINVGGLDQLVALLDGAVIGVNPFNGDLQWQVPFKADYSIAVATPVWGPDNLLFVSAEYGAGSKMIELQKDGQRTKAVELWSSNRLRLHHGNAMRVKMPSTAIRNWVWKNSI